MIRILKPKLLGGVSLLLLIGAPSVAQQAPYECAMEADGSKLRPQPRQSVVITDLDVFRRADFSFGRTLGQVLATAVNPPATLTPAEQAAFRTAASTRTEQIALLAGLIRSFRLDERVNPDSNVPMPLDPRPNEAKLDAVDLLTPAGRDGMRPIALFNRLDLAPASWSYCGEHRIVYAKGDGADRTNRFFLIFEAALDNPDPQNAKAGCVRVAEFWKRVSRQSGQALADSLARFYYEGDLGDGGPKSQPVVHHKHYGLPFGQIRGNLFVTGGDIAGNPWLLREWRTSLSGDNVANVVVDTVKANPHPDLYGPRKPGEPQDFADLRPEFQENFRLNHIREMIEAELVTQQENRPLEVNELLARLSARFENQFNAFQSISQARPGVPAEDPLLRAQGTELVSKIETDLKNFRLPTGANALTASHLLARAGALSCAGCHQLSVGQEIAPGVAWPAVAGDFTHTTEAGGLSPALEKHFLPARCGNMRDNLAPAAAPLSVALASPVAASATKARASLATAQATDNRADRIQALPTLESSVLEARRQDFKSPGAFVPFRRTH